MPAGLKTKSHSHRLPRRHPGHARSLFEWSRHPARCGNAHLLTGNSLTTVGVHVALHVASVLKGPEPTVSSIRHD
jgi:hypothetical protein